jgi:hypothetical protein
MKPYSIILKIDVILLITLLFILPHGAKAQGNLVINGGFDVDASNWTLSNGAFYAGSGKGDPGGWVGLDLQNPSSTSPDPTASQLINGLIPNQIYIVSGNFQRIIDWSNGAITGSSFGVAINDNFLFEAVDPENFNWQDFSFLYIATASSAVLSLSSQINGTEVSYGIDNIAMEAVPEPSSISLIMFGSGIVFYARRKKVFTASHSEAKRPKHSYETLLNKN